MIPAERSGGFLTLLKKRNFLYLWLAQVISQTVMNAANYALIVLIEEVTGSTTLIGLAIISFSIPAVLIGAPAGVFVDHMNKRRLLWGSNCLRAVATFLFVLSLILNGHQLLPAYLLTFLISIIAQFFSPAESSAIPRLVSEEELMPALSLFQLTQMMSLPLGFILLAPLVLNFLPTFAIAHFQINPIIQLYALVGVLYLVCAFLISMISPESLSHRVNNTANRNLVTQPLNVMGNVWSEMGQGWQFVIQRKNLFLSLLQLSFAGVLLFVISEIATPIVTKLLQFPASNMAFVFAPAGVGLVIGTVLMPRISGRLGKSRIIFIGAIGLAIATTLLPLVTLLARTLQPHGWNTNPFLLLTVVLIMAGAGFALDCINVPAQTAMQELSPDWIKGRVIALQLAFYSACSIPILLSIGAIADLFGIDRVLYLLSIGTLAFGLWGMYYERRHQVKQPNDDVVAAKDEPEPDTIAH